MRRFELPVLLHNLSRCEMQSNYKRLDSWNDRTKKEVLTQLRHVERICKESGLPAAKGVSGTIERIEADDDHFLDHLGHKISAVRNEIVAQLEQLQYLEIPRGDVALFQNPRPYGDGVWAAFPDCREDLEEAATCLSLDRGTACVMHLGRAIEMAMHALATAIEAKFKTSDQWDTILTEMWNILNKWGYQTDAEVLKKDTYRQVHITLNSVKLAWRHPYAHARFSATPEVARDIYTAMRGFMKQLTVALALP